MGQANQRKEEINKMKKDSSKNKDVTVRFIAMRYAKDESKPEIAIASVSFTEEFSQELLGMNKNKLLDHCSLFSWGHNPPIKLIAAYLLQTQSFKMCQMLNFYGLLINFLESDSDNAGHNSSRVVMSMSEVTFKDIEKSISDSLKDDAEYSLISHKD
jgi:hypothetical protein